MHKGQAIGFFDSGLGGISVLAAARAVLPLENYIYYGDSANAPYGTKSKEEVLRLTKQAVDQLVEMEIKALVIACNTATGIAAGALRRNYPFPIIGMEPALKVASRTREHGLILVMATPLTLSSLKYKALSRQFGEHAVDLPCPGLMDFVEREELDSLALDRHLQSLFQVFVGQRIDSVVLGCTHYLFIKRAIAKNLPAGTRVIDGNAGVAKQLQSKLIENNLSTDQTTQGSVRLVSSGGADKEEQMERMMQCAHRIASD